MRFILYSLACLGSLLLIVSVWLIWDAVSFKLAATIQPGEFLYYSEKQEISRNKDSDGRVTYQETTIYLPVFTLIDSDGERHRVYGTESHIFRVFDSEESIEVLVHPDPEISPRINAFIPLYGNTLSFLLIGLLILIPAVIGLRRSPPDTSVQEYLPFMLRFFGFGILVMAVFALILVAANKWFPEEQSATNETEEIESDALQKVEDSPSELDRLAFRAAQQRDPEKLRQLIGEGANIKNIPVPIVSGLVSFSQIETLEIIFQQGFDLSQTYGGGTMGYRAVAVGKSDVIKLVRKYGGPFGVPEEFIALAEGDLEGLRKALRKADPNAKFRGASIDRFAKKLKKVELLQQARAD